MAARVGLVQWVVANICVKIEGLRVVKNRVGYSLGFGRPIRGHEPTHARRIVPRAEVIQAGFGIPFFAGEFVGSPRSGSGARPKHRRIQGLREIRKQTMNKRIEEERRHQRADPFSASTHGAATRKVMSTQPAHWPSSASLGPIRIQYRIKSRAWTLTAMSPIVARFRRQKGNGYLTSRALKCHQA